MSHFFVSKDHIDGVHVHFSPSESHHLMRTLRYKIGDKISVFDGYGQSMKAKIIQYHKNIVSALILEKNLTQQPDCLISLFVAPINPQRLDWLIEKVTEIGVHKINFMSTQKTQLKWIDKVQSRYQRWKNIILAASKQSERTILPIMHADVMPFHSVIVDTYTKRVRKFILSTQGHLSLRHFHHSDQKNFDRIILLCGPESGFTKEEIDQAKQYQWHDVSLSKQVLRAETASMVSVALLLS